MRLSAFIFVKNDKFCFKLGKSRAGTIEVMQKAFRDEGTGKSQIKEWYKRFQKDRISAGRDFRYGRLSTTTKSDNIERVQLVVKDVHE